MLELVDIKAKTLPDAWWQLVFKALEICKTYKIDQGSYKDTERLEFDYVTIHVEHPHWEPLIPEVPEQSPIPPPCDMTFVENYLPYLMTSDIQPNESYTYGKRINKDQITEEMLEMVKAHEYLKKKADPEIELKTLEEMIKKRQFIYGDLLQSPILIDIDGTKFVDQFQSIIWTYKNKGHRNNQQIMCIARPEDILHKDPPCLRHIDTRIQDGKLHYIVYFRSWDLFNGLAHNLAAIQLMKEVMAHEIGVEDGEIIASSKGLHIYDSMWEIAEQLRGKTMKQIRSGK